MLRAEVQELPVRAETRERQYAGAIMNVLAWLMAWLRSWRPRFILEARQRSGQWRALRQVHLLKQPECAVCGRTKNLTVHHVIPVSVNPQRELDPENLLTMCETPCHFMFGHLFNYHCYNRNVRRMAAEFRVAIKKRDCPEHFL